MPIVYVFYYLQVEVAVWSIQQSEELLARGQLHDAFIASRSAIIASGVV